MEGRGGEGRGGRGLRELGENPSTTLISVQRTEIALPRKFPLF